MIEKKESIEKSVMLLRQDFIDVLSNDINNCNLPLFVIEPILKDVYLEVKSLLQKQYEIEKAEYEQKMKQYNEDYKVNPNE